MLFLENVSELSIEMHKKITCFMVLFSGIFLRRICLCMKVKKFLHCCACVYVILCIYICMLSAVFSRWWALISHHFCTEEVKKVAGRCGKSEGDPDSVFERCVSIQMWKVFLRKTNKYDGIGVMRRCWFYSMLMNLEFTQLHYLSLDVFCDLDRCFRATSIYVDDNFE